MEHSQRGSVGAVSCARVMMRSSVEALWRSDDCRNRHCLFQRSDLGDPEYNASHLSCLLLTSFSSLSSLTHICRSEALADNEVFRL